jgi:hypothetical protein
MVGTHGEAVGIHGVILMAGTLGIHGTLGTIRGAVIQAGILGAAAGIMAGILGEVAIITVGTLGVVAGIEMAGAIETGTTEIEIVSILQIDEFLQLLEVWIQIEIMEIRDIDLLRIKVILIETLVLTRTIAHLSIEVVKAPVHLVLVSILHLLEWAV